MRKADRWEFPTGPPLSTFRRLLLLIISAPSGKESVLSDLLERLDQERGSGEEPVRRDLSAAP